MAVPKSPPTHLLVRTGTKVVGCFVGVGVFRDTAACGELVSECARTTTMRRWADCPRCLAAPEKP